MKLHRDGHLPDRVTSLFQFVLISLQVSQLVDTEESATCWDDQPGETSGEKTP